MTVEEYRALERKAYVLGGKGQDRMIDNGWHIVCISPFDSDTKTAERLSGYDKVKVYKATTAVRGYHHTFAMVK